MHRAVGQQSSESGVSDPDDAVAAEAACGLAASVDKLPSKRCRQSARCIATRAIG